MAAKKTTPKENEEFQLEKAFEQLEQIIEKLEAEDTPLKESIELYGNGAKLSAACKRELGGIEKEMIVIGESLSEGEEE